MKNAMKKLMAFALVAVMLVAALPFQASAATGEVITFKVKYADGSTSQTIQRVPGNQESATAESILANWGKIDASSLVKVCISDDGENWTYTEDGSVEILAGQYVTIKVNFTPETEEEKEVEIVDPNAGKEVTCPDCGGTWIKGATPAHVTAICSVCEETYNKCDGHDCTPNETEAEKEPEKEPEVQQPTNDGNANVNPDTNSGQVNSSYNKFPYNVYLNIYNDTKLGSAEKVIKINDTAAEDGKVTLKEVKSIVKKYYNAIDTDLGIQYDGLYVAMGNWANDYIWDVKDSTIDDVDEMRNQSTVYINVMIDNAKLASSSTADSSNPKTGDNIFMAVSVMTLSASALAVFFFLNKKRAL